MKYILIVCGLIVVSCHKNRKVEVQDSPTTYEVERYTYTPNRFLRSENPTLEVLTFSQEKIAEDGFHLTYRGDSLIMEYYLYLDSTKMSEEWINGVKRDVPFSLIGRDFLVYNQSFISIYKFAKNYLAYDGCSNLFWTEETGILLERNPYWKGFYVYLAENNSEKKAQQLVWTTSLLGSEEFGAECGAY